MATTQTQQDTALSPPPEGWQQEVTRLSDLFSQTMTKILSQRLLDEMPEAQAAELTLPQLHALRHIWLHERILIGKMAEGMDISFPSATNMVKRLEEKGLVQRHINPDDRREVNVLLTPDGCDLISRIEQERVRRLTDVLQRMDAAEQSGLLNGLRQFVRLAVGDDVCTAEDICLRCGWRATDNCPVAQAIPLFACR